MHINQGVLLMVCPLMKSNLTCILTFVVIATSLEENTQITIMPLKIHVDPQVIDRFENYVYAMMELTEKWDKPTRPQEMRYVSHECLYE